MILNCTLFRVLDNSNATFAKCFNMSSKSLTDLPIFVSIKRTKTKGKLNKGDVCKAIIIRNKKKYSRYIGNFLSFDFNDIILLDMKNDMLGTRIFGLIPLELRKKTYLKLLSLSSHFI